MMEDDDGNEESIPCHFCGWESCAETVSLFWFAMATKPVPLEYWLDICEMCVRRVSRIDGREN